MNDAVTQMVLKTLRAKLLDPSMASQSGSMYDEPPLLSYGDGLAILEYIKKLENELDETTQSRNYWRELAIARGWENND